MRGVAGAVALALAGCEAPVAEVVVVVRADNALAGMLRNVRVEARRRGATTAVVQQTFPIARHPLPGYVAIVAADPDDARPLEVSVTADVGDPGRGDFTHRVVTRFQKNAVLYVDVLLADGCRAEMLRATCASLGLTCGAPGRCTPIDRPGTVAPPDPNAGLAPDVRLVCRPAATGPAVTTMQPCISPLDDAMERCGDGLDNDCDGLADDGCCARSCEGATGGAATHCREVIVAGGEMTLGESDPPTAPTVPGVTVGAFRMDAYEVTVARFRRYVAAGMPAPPANAVVVTRGVVIGPEAPGARPVVEPYVANQPLPMNMYADAFCNWGTTPTAWESDPINCVDWNTAMAFCVWDGGRLPTEAEWEFAARYRPLQDDTGNERRRGRRYPWGDREPTCDDANFDRCDTGYPRATRPVGTGMNGVGNQPTWLGLYDLAGNLEEYTADHFESYAGDCWTRTGSARFSMRDPLCVVPPPQPGNMQRFSPSTRGGSLAQPAALVRGSTRSGGLHRDSPMRDVGFRCVRMP
jgi:formylglycine-generating enzyme required for sulfatase activity